jgi:hypothetical protein
MQGETGSKVRQQFGRAFTHIGNGGEAWSAPQLPSECSQLRRAANGIDLHAPIGKILYITGNCQLFRAILSKVTKADALHSSRDVKSFRLLLFCHVNGAP